MRPKTKSSIFYYYLIKIGFPICFVIILWQFTEVALSPDYVDSHGNSIPSDVRTAYLFILPMILFFLGWLGWHFGYVDCQINEIRLQRNGKIKVMPWSEVSSIIQIPLCTPPVYRIAFTNNESAVYCSLFSLFVLSVGFWSWDFTDFKEYVSMQIEYSRQNRELPTEPPINT